MSEDLKIIIEAFDELDDEEQLDFYLHYEELFKEFIRIEKNNGKAIYDKKKCKEDEEYRKKKNLRNKKYYQKKKLEKEKNKQLNKNADITSSEKID